MSRRWMAPALGVLLCVVLAACAGRSSPRSTFNDGPPFGGPETEIVYSYSVKLIPPAGMADWESRKVASLPSIHLAELGASGTLSPEQRSMLAGKAGPSYIELPAIEKTGYVARRVDAGRYAFVKAVDVAQTGGQGLVCFDQAGRPLDASAVIDVRPGPRSTPGMCRWRSRWRRLPIPRSWRPRSPGSRRRLPHPARISGSSVSPRVR